MFTAVDRPIVFVGGKGGVGKTTTASALGLSFAAGGRRTLLVSTDAAHSLGDLFDRSIGEEETEVARGLVALEIDPVREVDRYLQSVKQNLRELVRPEMYKDIDGQIELTRMAPGVQEAALLERVSRILIEAPESYAHVVFDTAPTGSTLRLLSLPEVMTAWMEGLLKRREKAESFRESLRKVWREELPEHEAGSGGEAGREERRARRIREILDARRHRFSRARRILQDPERCAFVLVVIPEKLAILEGDRAYRALREAGIPVVCVVINRILPGEALGTFLESRRMQEAAYLEEIDETFADLPRIRVPLMEADVGSLEGLRSISRWLDENVRGAASSDAPAR